MSPENRSLLEAIREQAATHAANSAAVVDVANNRGQHIALTTTALEAASIVAALDIALGTV